MSTFDVGVLISRRVFRDCLRENSPYESLALYEEGGRKEGFSPVFFTIDQIRFADWTVNGVIRDGTGRLCWKRVPLPRVIHNRLKPMAHMPALTRLQHLSGTILFNGENRLDKWRVDRVLRQDPDVAKHLPDSALATKADLVRLLDLYRSVYVKPRDRSLGLGIFKVEKIGETGEVKVIKAHGRRAWIRPLSALQQSVKPTHLIQQAVSLMELEGCPVDIRVAVQRGRTGAWEVSGMVAKKGLRWGIVTNVAAGGTSLPMEQALEPTFPDPHSRGRIKAQIEKVAVATARQLCRKSPQLADLGIDIGVDQEGRVWVIEVNGRDLRITFRQAGERESWRKTYHKPMEYAGYLLKRETINSENGVAFLTPGTLNLNGKHSGSVETAVRQVAEHLVQTQSSPVYVIGKGVGMLEWATGIEIRSSDRRRYLNEAMGQLKRLRPRWIQVENRPVFVSHVKSAFPDTKVILSLHSERYLTPPHLAPERRAEVLSACDGVLTNSQFLKDRLLHWVPELEGRVQVLPLGVDLNRFLPREHPVSIERRKWIRDRLGMGESDRLLLFVGRWTEQKGVHHLLKAMRQMILRRSDIRLVVVGGSHYGKNLATPYVRQLKRLAKPLGSFVHWVPFVPHQQIPRWYAAADLLVVPSTGSEAFGLVNLEGMASSLPVVSVRTGGIPEVVKDGETGILVKPSPRLLSQILAETCCQLLSDPERMKRMGERGRKQAEQFGWSRVASRWIRLQKEWKQA